MRKVDGKFAAAYNKGKALRLYLPSFVSSLRLGVVPFLILCMGSGRVFLVDFLFLFAIASDKADGIIARKLGVSSRRGAAFDAFVDFLFVGSVFLYFGVIGLYPFWVWMLIVLMFVQFTVTSRVTRIFYDPFGKYYGSLLYGAVGLTILFSQPLARNIIMVSLVAVTLFSVVSRLVFLATRKAGPKAKHT
jgi:phosphatidylglycerophosphate synthase